MKILKLIAIIIVFLDGLFHFFASQATIMEYAPDWIIGLNIFNVQGMDISSHRTIGLYLIISSLYLLYAYQTNKDYDNFYLDVIVPATLLIIAAGIVVKFYYKSKNKFTNFDRLLVNI